MSINILNDKEVMLNREIGLIEFYRRVLAKTTDVTVPLLERLTYLCIVCKNCDELFEVRVARLLKWNKEEPGKILPDGLTAQAALGMVREAVVKLYDEIYDVYHNILIPELRAEKIYILDSNEWNNAQQSWAYNYFMQKLKSVKSKTNLPHMKKIQRRQYLACHKSANLNANFSNEANNTKKFVPFAQFA